MTDTKHTPGPWVDNGGGSIRDSEDRPIGHTAYNPDDYGSLCVANAARIIACVNALEGWTTEEIAALAQRNIESRKSDRL